MVLRSFGQWLFLSFVVVMFLTAGTIGLAVAWWGPNGIKAWGNAFIGYYGENEPIFDLGFRVVGIAITVITGLFGLHKALYFAERQLPARLQEYIKTKKNEQIVQDRDQVLAKLATLPQEVMSSLDGRKPELDRVRGLLNTAKESWDYEQATLHYANGQLRVLQANKHSEGAFAYRDAAKLREEAIEHYKQAAQLDPKDLRALEFAAQESEKLNDYQQAVEFWERLAQAQHQRGADYLQAQALYNAAKGLWERSKDPGLTQGLRNELHRKARDRAEQAIELLQSRSAPEWTELLANCFELVGTVRISLKTLRAAETALREACTLYQKLERPDVVRRLQERIAQTVREESATPDDADETDYAIGRAYELLGTTHLRRDDVISSRSKAERNLRLALAIYEQIDPRPEEAIARVEEKLRDPWLQ